jgi:hypothetical protein
MLHYYRSVLLQLFVTYAVPLSRCEVMTSCGWGKRVPSESHGLQLLRSQILRYFIDLRAKSGIRTHIWP